MIEEKDIRRLPERDEALKRGFELVLVKDSVGHVVEGIKYNKNEYVAPNSTFFYLNRSDFNTCLFSKDNGTPWFDIQKPKQRKMNLVEIDVYLQKEGKSLCWHVGTDWLLNTSIRISDINNGYENFGTLNPDGTFKPLDYVEDK